MSVTVRLLVAHVALTLTLSFVRAISCPANEHDFQKCDCTWDIDAHTITDITCTNANFQTDELLGTFLSKAPNVHSVTFTGNNIKELSINLFGVSSTSSLENLVYLDLSNNSIHIIHGQTFHRVPNLEVLKLNDNQWLVDSRKSRVFSSAASLRVLHLDNAFSHEQRVDDSHIVHLKNVFTYSTMWSMEELHMERNGIAYMDSSLFCNLPHLHRLYLSHNRLSKIDLECLEELEELYFEFNDLSNVGPWMQDRIQNLTYLEHLTLYGNIFQCTDCPGSRSTSTFRDWLHTSASSVVYDKDSLICQQPKGKTQGKFLYNVTDGQLEGTCPEVDEYKSNKEVVTIAVGMVVLSLLLVAIIVVIINRDKIRQHQGGWCDPLKDGARNVLKNNLHIGYATMTDDLEEEMCNISA